MDAESLKPRWQFVAWPKMGQPGVPQWADFTDEHNLNDLVYEKAREAQGNAHNIVEYQWGSVVYEIDIVNMTQKNTKTGCVRPIRLVLVPESQLHARRGGFTPGTASRGLVQPPETRPASEPEMRD